MLLPHQIKKFREANGLNQRQFAEVINMSPKDLSRIELFQQKIVPSVGLLLLSLSTIGKPDVGYDPRLPIPTTTPEQYISMFRNKQQFRIAVTMRQQSRQYREIIWRGVCRCTDPKEEEIKIFFWDLIESWDSKPTGTPA